MQTALITGGAVRIGAQISKTIHNNNFNVIIHYNKSKIQAKKISAELNKKRKHSAQIIKADFTNLKDIEKLITTVGDIDLLVNNASVYYPTPIQSSTIQQWDNIINSNIRAPYLLSKGFSARLKKNKGCIINIVDIHANRPLKEFPIYNISKAGIKALTKALAQDLAPDVRVCGVSPGSIFCKGDKPDDNKQKIIQERVVLKKQGNPQDIADAVIFLMNSKYITGHIINVDGGRCIYQ